jgi:Right handed beta helix region
MARETISPGTTRRQGYRRRAGLIVAATLTLVGGVVLWAQSGQAHGPTTGSSIADQCQTALGYPGRSASDLAWLHSCVTALTPPIAPTTTPPVTPTSPGNPTTGKPGPGNTGPGGTSLQPFSGELRANTTYDGVAIPSTSLPTYVTVSGLTLRNCTLATGVIFTGDNITIENCAIHGGISFSGSNHVRLKADNIFGWDDGLHITSDSRPTADYTILGNWIHGPAATCSDHSDGIQILGTNGAVIRANNIDLGPWMSCGSDPGDGPLNAAIQIETTQGPVNQVVVDDNWLNGGGYMLRVYQGCTQIHVTGNAFGPTAQFGPADTLKAGAGIVGWAGNHYEATGVPIQRQ